jgi:splicing factor 3B subunit 3
MFDIVGVDVGFENPLFAAIEINYEDADHDPSGDALVGTQKCLTFYELDLGLNHCSKQTSEPIPMSSNMVLSVPGTPDGPGGVIILAEDQVIHRTIEHEDVNAYIPRRRDIPRAEGCLITSATLVKQRDWFFFLIQNEQGDLFKVWLDYDGDDVTGVNVKYFDTIPVATSMSVLKTGFLFSASESGNHYLYQFQGIGDDDEDVTLRLENDDRIFFRPRPLRNLVSIDELPNAFPVTDMVVENFFQEETPQIVTTCGTGSRSSLRVLRHGLAVGERAVSQLPGVPSAVWSIKTHVTEDYDRYIVVSFKDATMVLSIGETVEEIHDSGFLPTAPTIMCGLFGENSLIQVHP